MPCLRVRIRTALMTTAAIAKGAPARNAAWYPPVRAASCVVPAAVRLLERAVARLVMLARPRAPPIMREVLVTPEPRPALRGVEVAHRGQQ